MGRRLGRAATLARDAVVILISVVIIGSQYKRLSEEPVFYVTVSISAVLLVLSAVDAALMVVKPGWRRYFLANGTFQLIPGVLYLGLILPLGVIIVGLNIVALVSLREKKTAEELAAHPPLPRTRNYKILDGAGTLVMLVSLFLPWLDAPGSGVSLFGVYSALVTHSDLPEFAISQTGVLLALLGLVGSPTAVVCGALGMVRRKFSGVAGILGIAAGVGVAIAVGNAVGAGAYMFGAGGAVVLVGSFGFRKR